MAIFQKYKAWLDNKMNPGRGIDEEQRRIDAEAEARAEEAVAAERQQQQQGEGAPEGQRMTGGGRRL